MEAAADEELDELLPEDRRIEAAADEKLPELADRRIEDELELPLETDEELVGTRGYRRQESENDDELLGGVAPSDDDEDQRDLEKVVEIDCSKEENKEKDDCTLPGGEGEADEFEEDKDLDLEDGGN